jgi:hypothetical protein
MADDDPRSRTRTDLDHGTLPKDWSRAAATDRLKVALESAGATVRTSECRDPARYFLYDPRRKGCPMLETIPAWIEIAWPSPKRIGRVVIQPGMPEYARAPQTECAPLDYRFLWRDGAGAWHELFPPVVGAPRYHDLPQFPHRMAHHHQEKEYLFEHDFPPVETDAVRMEIARTSDAGVRRNSGGRVVVPPGKRKTVVRRIEVFEA